MGKGGRYLKKKDKKGRGWKIALVVLAVLAVLIGGVRFAAARYYNSMLDKIKRAEVVDKGASVDDVLDAATFNPDKFSEETAASTAPTTEPSVETGEGMFE